MKISDLSKIIKVILPNVKTVKNMSVEDVTKWTVTSAIQLAAVCFFLWFLINVLHVSASIGK